MRKHDGAASREVQSRSISLRVGQITDLYDGGMQARKLDRRQFVQRSGMVAAGLSLLAVSGCKQPVPPAEMVQTRPPATPTRPSPPVVGVIWDDDRNWLSPEFARALREQGYEDGRTVTIEARSAGGQPNRLA